MVMGAKKSVLCARKSGRRISLAKLASSVALRIAFASFAFAPFILVGRASGQAVTWAQVVTWSGSSSITSAAASDVFRNIGQSSSWVYYCLSGTSPSAEVEIEASNDGATWVAISQISNGTGDGCAVVTAGGYFNDIRVNVLTLSGTMSATYSASIYPIAMSGVSRLGTAANPVSQVASVPLLSGSVAALPVSIPVAAATDNVTISGFSAYNPNTSVVYVQYLNSSGTEQFFFPVQPSTAWNQNFTSALLIQGEGGELACSTSPTSLVAPATGCPISTFYHDIPNVNTSITTGGVPTYSTKGVITRF